MELLSTLNGKFVEIFGYDLEDVPKYDIWMELAFPSEAYRQIVDAKIRIRPNVRSIGKFSGISAARVRCKDGAEKIVSIRPLELENARGVLVFEDVTLQRRTEQALKESETRYRTLFEFLSDGIFLIQNYRFSDCNNGAVEMFGLTKSELIGHGPEEFSPDIQPDGLLSSEKSRRFMDQALGGEAQTFQWRHKKFDGTIIEAEVSLNRLELSDGVFILAIVRDVTEKYKAEQELRRRDRLMEKAAYSSHVLLTWRELDFAVYEVLKTLGRAVDVDRAYIFENLPDADRGQGPAKRRFEWYADDLGLQSTDLMLKDIDYETGFGHFHQALCSGRPVMGPVRNFPPSERAVLEAHQIISLMAVPITVDEGFWGFIGFDDCHSEREWTDGEVSILQAAAAGIGGAIVRNRAATACAGSELRYRSLFQDSPVSLWELDLSELKSYLDSIKEYCDKDLSEYFHDNPEAIRNCVNLVKIVDVNKVSLDLHGVTDKQALVRSVEPFLCKENSESIKQAVLAVAEGKSEFEAETVMKTLSGEIREVFVRCSVIQGSQKPYARVLASLLDTTERKKAERELQISEDRYRKVIEAAQDIIYMTDSKGLVHFVNPATLNKLGFSREEIIGKHYLCMVHPEQRREVERFYGIQYMKKIPSSYHEVSVLTKSGSVLWLGQKRSRCNGRRSGDGFPINL